MNRSISAGLIALVSLTAQAATFPATWQPVAINEPDGGVVNLGDPTNDGNNNGRNIVGDNARPAFFTASDSTHFFFRMRLDTDPTGPGGLNSYGWGILIDADGDIRDYDYALMINGTGEAVEYSKKTAKTLAGDPSELADVLINTTPTVYSGASQNVRISSVGAGSAGFSSNEDYFLDVAVPLSTLYGTNPDGGAYLNFSPSTTLRFWVGISNSSRQIQLDLGGTGSNPGPGSLGGTVSVPQLLCGTDSSCGSTTSGKICSSGTCIDGCRGSGGNGCPSGYGCTSANTDAGTCVASAAPVLVAPANGSVTNDNTPNITGTSPASATITVYIDGISAGTTTANGSGAWTFTASTLTNASHTVYATSTVTGVTSGNSNTNTFTVDTAAPSAPVVVAPANGGSTNDNTPTISGTAEASSTVTVYIDGVSVGTTTTSGLGAWTFNAPSTLADGSHTARATATDAASNTSSNSNTNTFSVDTATPAAPVVVTPANGSATNDNTPTVSGTAEANSTVTVYIDGISVGTTTASGGGAWSLTTSTLADGAHTARATATDAASNTSGNSNTNTFTVDTATPSAPVVIAPANGSTTGDNTPTISGTSEANATITVFIDGSSAGTTTANGSGAWSFDAPLTLLDGPHTARATATDAATNTSGNSNTNTFTVDTSGPPAPVVIDPQNGIVLNDNTPTVAGTSPAVATITVYIDGVSVGTTTADIFGEWFFTSATLIDGNHTVYATATVAVVTSAPSNTRFFTIDTAAPSAPVVLAPASGSKTADNTPTLSGTAEANSTVEVFIDGASVGTTTATGLGAWSFDAPVTLADGSHTARATSTDAAGNTSVDSNTNTFTVDTTAPLAPVVLAPANSSATNDTTPTISGTAEANSTVTVFIDGNSAGTTTADGVGDWTFDAPVALTDGAHTARVTATDSVGNTSGNSNTNTFTVDTAAPSAPVVLAPADGSSTNDNTPTISGTAEADSTVTVFIDGASVGTTTANGIGGAWTFDAPLSLLDGAHTARATATDTAGNTSGNSNTNSFTVDATAPSAPVVQAPANGSSTRDTTPTISGTAEANSTVTVFIDGLSVGTTTANGSGIWAFDAPVSLFDGFHTARVTAADALGNTSGNSNTNTFIVDTVAPAPPNIISPANGSTTADNTPNIFGVAAANSTVTIYIDGASVGTATANGIGSSWNFTASTLADGPHTVYATATDEAGNTSVNSITKTFTVDTTAPLAPVVLAPADGSSTNDNTPTISGTAEANSTVTVFIDGASVGTTTADSLSGAWSFDAPLSLLDGSHTAKATATDAVGHTSVDSNTNTFAVDTAAPSAPVVVAPAHGSVTQDNTPTFTGTADPSTTVTVRVDGDVVCTTTADSAGQFSCSASAPLSEGERIATASASNTGGSSNESNPTHFFIDVTSPLTPVVVGPANGSTTTDSTPTIVGTGEPGSTITVTLDTQSMGTVVVAADGTWALTLSSPLSLGAHTVHAQAVDAAGNSSLPSNANTFTVAAPSSSTPVLLTPVDNASLNTSQPTFTGTCAAIASITVRVDGVPACSATADSNGAWSCAATSPLADGPHQALAQTPGSGDSNTNTFSIDTSAPAAPVVTQPVDGSSTSQTTPTLAGTAEPMSTVAVFLDGLQLGTANVDVNGQWSLTLSTPLTLGPHTVTATATDRASNTSLTSTPSSFTVVAPSSVPVVLTPAPGSSTRDSTPLLSGTAPPAATVEVLIDGTVVCTTTATASGSYSCVPTTPVPDGPHTATAREQGSSTLSEPVAFTVDTVAPASPVVTEPTPNAITGVLPVLAGTAEPGARVEVRVDGTAICVTLADAQGNWSCVPPSPLSMGSHTVAALATDVAGNTSAPSPDVPFVVDTMPPAAPVISAPTDGATTGDSTPHFEGTAEPGSTVTVRVDGVVVCVATADSSGAFQCDAATAIPDGSHQVTAVATDAGGNASTASSPITFTVDTVGPAAPSITGPTEGALLADATPTLSGTATPGVLVTVREGSTVICTATADSSGAWSCDASTLPDGAHSFTATATEAGQDGAPSAARSFTVDTTPPLVDVTGTPTAPTVNTNATAKWNTEPGTTYQCSIDGGAFTTCTSPLNLNGLAPGDHSLTVRATDAAGNTTEKSVSWLVETTKWELAGSGISCAAVPVETLLPLLALAWALRRRKLP